MCDCPHMWGILEAALKQCQFKFPMTTKQSVPCDCWDIAPLLWSVHSSVFDLLHVCALQVLDLLEDACEGLLSHVESKKFATESWCKAFRECGSAQLFWHCFTQFWPCSCGLAQTADSFLDPTLRFVHLCATDIGNRHSSCSNLACGWDKFLVLMFTFFKAKGVLRRPRCADSCLLDI